MDCRFFEKKMADYLEGNLSQIEAEETQRHLSSCQACSQKFKTVRNVRYALKNLRRIHPSIGFNFALYSRIKREIRKRRPPIKSTGGRPSIESIGGDLPCEMFHLTLYPSALLPFYLLQL